MNNFCSTCGTTLAPETKFCGSCGSGAAALVAISQPQTPKRSVKRILLIIAGVFILGRAAYDAVWGWDHAGEVLGRKTVPVQAAGATFNSTKVQAELPEQSLILAIPPEERSDAPTEADPGVKSWQDVEIAGSLLFDSANGYYGITVYQKLVPIVFVTDAGSDTGKILLRLADRSARISIKGRLLEREDGSHTFSSSQPLFVTYIKSDAKAH